MAFKERQEGSEEQVLRWAGRSKVQGVGQHTLVLCSEKGPRLMFQKPRDRLLCLDYVMGRQVMGPSHPSFLGHMGLWRECQQKVLVRGVPQCELCSNRIILAVVSIICCREEAGL